MLIVDRFTRFGLRLPPIPVFGAPGSVWPPESPGYLRIDGVSRGTAGARLLVLGLEEYATFEARLVVAGVPGAWTNVSEEPGLAITGDAGEAFTIDLRATWLSRDAGLEIVGYAPLRVVAHGAAGY